MSRMTTIWASGALLAGLIVTPSFAGEMPSTAKDALVAKSKLHDCCPDGGGSNALFGSSTGMELKGGPKWVGSTFKLPEEMAAHETRQAEVQSKTTHHGPPSKRVGR